jgi:hypothetical protein
MFAIKAEVSDPWAETFAFSAQKTMYGGKHILAALDDPHSRLRGQGADGGLGEPPQPFRPVGRR